jgi:hypothetical protein
MKLVFPGPCGHKAMANDGGKNEGRFLAKMSHIAAEYKSDEATERFSDFLRGPWSSSGR